MRVLLTKKALFITAVAFILAIVTLVSVNVYGSSGPVTALANAVTTPLKTLASTVARTFESIYNNIYRYEQLYNAHEEVLMENARLRENYRDADDLRAENDFLRAALNFSERNPRHVLEPALIQGWTSDNWSSTFTINRGYSNSETSAGNPVVTEYGVLVGIVADVSASTSTVLSVLDTTFTAGAFIGEGGGHATATGDFSLMNRGRLRLDHIDDSIPVLPGDAIVTSGSAGRFPAGLVIGEVEEVFPHNTGIGRYAAIRPIIPLDTVLRVLVVTEFDVADTGLAPRD